MTAADEMVQKVAASIEATYGDPVWGLKADTKDVARDAGEAIGVDLSEEALDRIGEALWNWQSDQPSPFTEGLVSLVEDGLAPGTTIPVAEIAGAGETEAWEMRQARFLLEQIEAEVRRASS